MMTNALKKTGIARTNSDGRREAIIEATLRVMTSEGLYHATTRKIAEASGLSLATLHYHFNDKEEIFFLAMELLISNYRGALARQFTQPQTLDERIPTLISFIWGEIEKNPDEQLALQEMTIYLLRDPRNVSLARDKDREFLSLFVDTLKGTTDANTKSEAQIVAVANLIYTGLVGIFNQWLATRDKARLIDTLDVLAASAQRLLQ